MLARNEAPAVSRSPSSHPLMLLTFVRTSELIYARWKSSTPATGVIIPGEREDQTAARVPPLAPGLRILKERRPKPPAMATFPVRRRANSPMHYNTIQARLQKLGYAGKMTRTGSDLWPGQPSRTAALPT